MTSDTQTTTVCASRRPPRTLSVMDLDHVALGLRDVTPVLTTLVGDLGGDVLDGGQSLGFRIVQVRVGRRPHLDDPGEGMTVELMEPWAVDRFDFLARFLDHRGEGPHHITFKTTDIRAELERLAAEGFEPVRTQLVNPWWREAFFHPKDTFGTVIQIAEAHFDPSLAETHEEIEGDFGSIEWWPEPPPRADTRAVLRRVVIGVPAPELDAAEDFFTRLLGANAPAGHDGDLVWPGGGRLQLVAHDGAAGILRYECEQDGAVGDRVVGGAPFRFVPPA